MLVKVELNAPRIMTKVENDRLGRFTAQQWHRLMIPYTPRRTGRLIRNVAYMPHAIHYKEPYAHYMYEGKVYVDPQTGASGFLTDKGWRSRRNIRKIPTARSFSYNKTQSPYATDHWDIVAARSGQRDKLYRTINNALQNGNF